MNERSRHKTVGRVARTHLSAGLVAAGVLGLMPITAWAAPGRSIARTPNSTTEQGQLDAVSCTSAKTCIAVGFDGAVTLAEAWSGKNWTIEATPKPAGARDSQLAGVSCKSAATCTAVGGYYNSARAFVALAEGWNGKKWAIQATPKPAGPGGSFLYGMSCALATACTAVGGHGAVTLAEAWNGKKWTIEPTPNPTGSFYSTLFGVSCTSAAACTAIGDYYNTPSTYVTLAEGWNGKRWTIEPVPKPAGALDGTPFGVSCKPATACIAVGSHRTKANTDVTLAEAWNGKRWVIDYPPNPATPSSLSGVSCTSAAACTAVGSYSSSAETTVPLAEAWNGKTWTIEPTPKLAGTGDFELSGVSCTSATACTAVGRGPAGATLAEAWNGKKWTIEP